MIDVWDNVLNSFDGFANWAIGEFTFNKPVWYINYFLWLIIISGLVFGLEILIPWRKTQKIIRKDFWKDFVYMFLNFYVFAFFLTGFFTLFSEILGAAGLKLDNLVVFNLNEIPTWAGLLVFFVVNDFVQWFTHYLLHKIPVFWTFHKVHHSVKEMGFAAHLRYHWMENVFYKPLKTLVVLLFFGVEPQIAFIVHFISIAIGHLNHANVDLNYGPLKYVFNNPKMHLWHHV